MLILSPQGPVCPEKMSPNPEKGEPWMLVLPWCPIEQCISPDG